MVTAPSARWLVDKSGATVGPRLSRRSRALFIGDPAFSREFLPGKDPLPAAVAEVALAGESFPNSVSLSGTAATIQAFWSLAPEAAIVHFAGHAIARTDEPGSSALVFAPSPDGEDTGILYAREIATHRLANVRLVALAACDTARNGGGSDDSTSSLARAFLAAGARSVLATLWPVDDQVSAAFFAVFYRELAANGDVTAAYATALRSLRTSSDEKLAAPRSWGAFQLTTTFASPT